MLEGERDAVVDGKLYRIKAGDILTVPSGAALRHPATGALFGNSPLMDSLIVLIMLAFRFSDGGPHAEAAMGILACVGEILHLLDILDRDKSLQGPVPINDRQFLHLVAHEDGLGVLQSRPDGRAGVRTGE